MKTIVITLQVPDGVNVSVGQSQASSKPFVAREDPPVPNGYCPIHEVPWKLIPAGVSRTKVDDQGNPKRFNAFYVCSEQGCNEKPPKVNENITDLPF